MKNTTGNCFRIIYFDRTQNGENIKFVRVLNMPYERVWQIAHTSVYQYSNYFKIEKAEQLRYKFLFADGLTCTTVASSCNEAESHFTKPLRLLSIDRLQNVVL